MKVGTFSELIPSYTSKVGEIFIGSSQLTFYCTKEGQFIKDLPQRKIFKLEQY
jgi:site-specific DNA-adenine methylase